jgi:hypothetical protein
MKKGVKIALGVGIPLLLGGVTYFILRKRVKDKGCAKSKFGATIFGTILCPAEEELDIRWFIRWFISNIDSF